MEALTLIVGFGILTICFVQLFLIIAYIKMATDRWYEQDDNKFKEKLKKKLLQRQQPNARESVLANKKIRRQ